MKLILKNKEEIIITSMNENYNAKTTIEGEKRILMLRIDNVDNYNIDNLLAKLTPENLSEFQVVSNSGETVVRTNMEVKMVSDNIDDIDHKITIHLCPVGTSDVVL